MDDRGTSTAREVSLERDIIAYGKKVNMYQRWLCAVVSFLEDLDYDLDEALDFAVKDLDFPEKEIKDFMAWWKNHKAKDARERQEKRRQLLVDSCKAKVKKKDWFSITEDEAKAYGIKKHGPQYCDNFKDLIDNHGHTLSGFHMKDMTKNEEANLCISLCKDYYGVGRT